MRLDEKVRSLFRSGHPATDISEEKSRESAEVRPAKGAKPGDKVVRLIRTMASKTKKRRKG